MVNQWSWSGRRLGGGRPASRLAKPGWLPVSPQCWPEPLTRRRAGWTVPIDKESRIRTETGTVGEVRRVLHHTGGFGVAAICFVSVGVLFLITILLSANSWQWWSARAVQGSELSGVVSYEAGGRSYSLDDPGSLRNGPRTVWVDPANPSSATLSVTVARISDTAITFGPVLIAVVLVVAGVVRSRRHARRIRAAEGDERAAFGTGLDPDAVRALLDERRRAEYRPPHRYN